MNVSKLIGLAIAAAVLTTTFAQAGSGIVSQVPLQLRPVAACQLASGEFPNDIWVTNKGAGVIKAGAKVNWNVPNANTKGTYVLIADLAPGKSVFLSNVIPGSTEAGYACKATVTV